MSFLRTFRQLRKGLISEKFHAQSLAPTNSLTACGLPSRGTQQISSSTALQWNGLGTSSGSTLSELSSTSPASSPPAHRLISSSRLRFHSQQCRSAAKQHLSMSIQCFSMTSATVRRWQSGLSHHTPIQHGDTGSSIARGFASQTQRSQQRRQLQKKSSEQGVYLVALVVGMVGLTYASVPLYRMFCQATGFGGTVQEGRSVEDKLRAREERPDAAVEAAAAAREIIVSFNADVADGMPWRFVPAQHSVKVHPGQSTLVFYTAHNASDKAITGVSTYNVAPQQAGYYFNKIQCFCFEEQKLRPGEKIDMPVFFYIDPEFATDPRMKGINHLTLSYTFFNVEEEAVDVDGETVPAAALIGRERHSNPAHAAAG